MQYGICLLSVVPCRKEAASTSEMVTQLLFGDHYKVVEDNGDWMKIVIASDGYECWLNAKQYHKISENTYHLLEKEVPIYNSELIQVITNRTTITSFPITMGARLPFFKDNKMTFDDYSFSFEGPVRKASEKKTATEITSTAFSFLNAPYLWGGKNPFGIDCSGFTQIIYRLNGYQLPRDAYQQVELGTALSFVEEAEAGDLAFFDNEEGRIVHVGILLDHQTIIHASGNVRVDRFDHYGIHHSELRKYSHTLRVIKRIL